jgi:hypothetical protein
MTHELGVLFLKCIARWRTTRFQKSSSPICGTPQRTPFRWTGLTRYNVSSGSRRGNEAGLQIGRGQDGSPQRADAIAANSAEVIANSAFY